MGNLMFSSNSMFSIPNRRENSKILLFSEQRYGSLVGRNLNLITLADLFYWFDAVKVKVPKNQQNASKITSLTIQQKLMKKERNWIILKCIFYVEFCSWVCNIVTAVDSGLVQTICSKISGVRISIKVSESNWGQTYPTTLYVLISATVYLKVLIKWKIF